MQDYLTERVPEDVSALCVFGNSSSVVEDNLLSLVSFDPVDVLSGVLFLCFLPLLCVQCTPYAERISLKVTVRAVLN